MPTSYDGRVMAQNVSVLPEPWNTLLCVALALLVLWWLVREAWRVL